jgi:hypothetical protein
VRVTDNVGATADQVLSVVVGAAVQVTTTSVPAGQVGVAYSTTLAASGGTPPYLWALAPGSDPLPGGLTLSSEGVLSGTPTVSGTFGFTVRVTDAMSATADQALTLTIDPAPLVIGTTTVARGRVRQGYAVTLSAAGGVAPYGWSLAPGSGPLPGGVALSTGGELSGTPTEHGSFGITVRVTDALAVTADQALTLVIDPAALTVTTTVLEDANLGLDYSQTLAVQGGVPPYMWMLSTNSAPLPIGLTVSTNGELGGIPVEDGQFAVTLSVRDSQGTEATKVLSLTVRRLIATLSVQPQTGAEIAAQGFRLEFISDVAGDYWLQFSESIGPWSNLFSFTASLESTNLMDQSAGSSPARSYRVKKE